MLSKVQICNLALRHIGSSRLINSLDEGSQEANVLSEMFDITVAQIFRDVRFPFSKRIKPLALVSESPNSLWMYAYKYPTECVDLHGIKTSIRCDDYLTRSEYDLLDSDEGTLILTSIPEAYAQFSVVPENPAIYPPDVDMAISFLLGFNASVSLMSGDSLGIGDKLYGKYRIAISTAAKNAKSESFIRVDPIPAAIKARY